MSTAPFGKITLVRDGKSSHAKLKINLTEQAATKKPLFCNKLVVDPVLENIDTWLNEWKEQGKVKNALGPTLVLSDPVFDEDTGHYTPYAHVPVPKARANPQAAEILEVWVTLTDCTFIFSESTPASTMSQLADDVHDKCIAAESTQSALTEGATTGALDARTSPRR